MKRGLKVGEGVTIIPHHRRYNPCPDEKGTESRGNAIKWEGPLDVTTLAPMKRGLKETL